MTVRAMSEAATRAAAGAHPKSRTFRMIGNAHIDPVWLWRWQEGLQEVRSTFRSAVDRLAEYPEFVFTANSAAYYEWIEQSDPDLFAEIQRLVAEGRWEIVGGWWIEPDANLPGGESLVRQGLYGQRYFQEKFGRMATVGYNVDTFGHSAMLPQILAKSGMDAYVFMRPQPHELELPGRVFWWESPDGSRVLAARIPHEYCSPRDGLERYLDDALAKLGDDWDDLMMFYGVGNHGGGPTKANIEGLCRAADDPERPTIVFDTPSHFFADMRAADRDFPKWTSELQHHARGCYAAHSEVKRLNRRVEQQLVTAEKLSAIALWATGQPYPGDLDRAWKDVLFNQFHDIVAGTSIEAAYDDARDLYGEAAAISGRALNLAFQAISRRIDIPLDAAPGGIGSKPVVVLNPHAWPSRPVVELETGGVKDGDILVDEDDRALPMQFIQSLTTAGTWRRRIAFAPNLPSMGYRTLRILSGAAAEAILPAPPAVLDTTDTSIDNGIVRVAVDPETGAIASLRLVRAGAEVLAGPGARAIVYGDRSDTWGHDVVSWDEVAGEFRAARVRLVEDGPVRATIRIESEFGQSRLVQDVSLAAGSDRVELRATLDWRERRKLLKLRFATAFATSGADGAVATADIPYGNVERPIDGAEEPGQAWLDVGAARFGLSVLNDGKYAFDVASLDGRADLGITVARSPIYAHHNPALPDEDAQYGYLDQGIQRFTLVLLPHAATWREAGTTRAAAELNQPAIGLLESFHDGPLPQTLSFAQVDDPAVIVEVVKRAEDDDALIVRARETGGSGTRATISLPEWGRYIDAQFAPCEILTFRVPRDTREPVVETDLLERPLPQA